MPYRNVLNFTTFFLIIVLTILIVIFFFPTQNKELIIILKELTSIITPIIGVMLFWRGVVQYEKDQRWKNAEFVAKEINEFKSDPVIKNVMLMLDWKIRDIKLSECESFSLEDDIYEELYLSLVPKTYEGEKDGFTKRQALIRDHFDIFFDYLEKFEAFIEVGLLDKKDFDPYLHYWLHLIGDKNNVRKPSKFYETIWQYIHFFRYKRVQKLMSRYGYSIKTNVK